MIARCLFIFLSLVCINSYASGINQYYYPPIVEVSPIPEQTYTTYIVPNPQPVVVYQWMPQTIQTPVYTHKVFPFRQVYRMEYRPVTVWKYEPFIYYR